MQAVFDTSKIEMVMMPKRSFLCCLAVLVGCYAITIYAGVFEPGLYVYLLSEDGPLENLATLFTLIASILFGLAYLRYKSQSPYLLLILSLLLLFVFFEEISWGQRFFKIETPETFERLNAQKEINFHNYSPIYRYVNGVAYVGLDLYLIGLPLSVFLVKGLRGLLQRLKIPMPSPATAFLTFFNYFLFTHFFERFLHEHGNLGQGEINYGEMLETGIELALLLFALECFSRGMTWVAATEDDL